MRWILLFEEKKIITSQEHGDNKFISSQNQSINLYPVQLLQMTIRGIFIEQKTILSFHKILIPFGFYKAVFRPPEY